MTGEAVSRPRKVASQQTHLAIDWMAGHGNVTAPVAIATTATAVASLGAWADMPSGWPLLVGVAGAAAHGIGVGIRRRLSKTSMGVRAAAWLAAGGWSSTVIASDPTTWGAAGWWSALGTLTAIGLGAGAGLVKADIHEEALDESRRAMEAAMVEANLARAEWDVITRWVDLIRNVAHVEVTPAGFEHRKNGSGFGLEVALPIGYTADRFQTYGTALAEAARLPVGCLVSITKAGKQGHVILDVDTENTSSASIPFPGDFSPLSVNGGLPWGLDRTGEEVKVFMRGACALILGPPDTGKTTLLDTILTQFNRCTDALVFGIDIGKKGDAFAPWLRTWMEGQGMASPPPHTARLPKTTRPGVDWVAATIEEADAILDALIRIAEARLAEYRELMHQKDSKLLPISAKIPMIFCVVDEGAEMLSYQGRDPLRNRVREKLVTVMRTTRAMGVRLILTATDGNLASLGDSAVRKYSPVRVALTSTDAEGAGTAKLFGQVKGLDARQLRAKGAGVIGQAGDPGFAPKAFRTWVTAPSLARDACLATEATRPVLDDPSVRAAGDAYRERWAPEKLWWLTSGKVPAATPGNGASAPDPAQGGSPRGYRVPELKLRVRGQEPTPAPEDHEAEVEKFLAELSKLPEAEEPRPREDKPHGYRVPELKLNIRRQDKDKPSGDDGQAVPGDSGDWKQAALRIVQEAGADVWLSTSEIRARMEADGIEVHRSSLATELGEMARRGQISKRGTGPQTRYGSNGQ